MVRASVVVATWSGLLWLSVRVSKRPLRIRSGAPLAVVAEVGVIAHSGKIPLL